MRRSLMFLGVLAMVAFRALLPAQAGVFQQDADGMWVQCPSSPCVVRSSGGGSVDSFVNLAQQLKVKKMRLVIDGLCASACVLLADKARPQTCITRRAVFAVHKTSGGWTYLDTKGRFADTRRFQEKPGDPPQSADIDRYVKKRGGYPLNDLRVISYKQALRFWPKC